MKTFSTETAADFLNIHPTTLIELTSKGDIPAAKIGRAYVYLEDDLVGYVRAKVKEQTEARRKKLEERKVIIPAPIATSRAKAGRKQNTRPDLSVYA
jgi:excisionase family DNA binding protein